MIELHGKVGLVTGATRSIGEGIVRGLHAAGARVLVTGIQDAEGQAIAASLGERAFYSHLDLRSDRDIDTALATCIERFGRLDFVINCACSYVDSGVYSTRAEWLESFNVNVAGHAVLVNAALAHLTQPGGVVVNIGSVSGKFGIASRGPYSVGKAALMHYTRVAAVALAPRGIRVVTVSSGWTWSPPMEEMTEGSRDLADGAGAVTHPLGRVGRMTEVANVVVFACSDEASWVTGCDLPVDGGFSAQGPDQGKGPAYWVNRVRAANETAANTVTGAD
jgi:3-oxoacyl-[acyl-carrier protein] reductase